jgi:hypothetical protein
MSRLIPKKILYDSLPQDSMWRIICEKEEFYISDRNRDWA